MLSGETHRPGIEDFQELSDRGRRTAAGRFVIEGARFVHVALRTRTSVDAALVAPDLLDRSSGDAAEALRRSGALIHEVSRAEFEAVSTANEPSGVAAIVSQRWGPPSRPQRRETPLWLAVGHVRSPGNLGTLLRTASAAGAAGALLLDRATDPHHPVAVRASMGAVLDLSLSRMTPDHLRAWKRRTGAVVVGTSANAHRDFRDLPRRRPLVVVMGCERRGMSAAERRACDFTVTIPMAPGTSSLNVGVAAGVLLFGGVGPRVSRSERAARPRRRRGGS